MTPGVAPGTRACIGLPQATCARAFEEAEARARERGTVVIGIIIRCTAVCTDASGEAEQSVTYGDGSTEQGGFGWQSTVPAPRGQPIEPELEAEPSLPIAPTCVDLEPEACLEKALESVRDLEPDLGDVVSIVVRCTPGPCTPTAGDGETMITYADGQIITVGWSYRGAP
jgi:hypothetical protein